jgi:NADPH:quinone reductase-like Zn-dependent oxidoreductase
MTMQICLAKGATVYVTSGSDDKIQKAVDLGAKAGANYKTRKYIFNLLVKADLTFSSGIEDWPSRISDLLETSSDGRSKVELDAIIDSGGGDVLGLMGGHLKAGGRLVCYGM